MESIIWMDHDVILQPASIGGLHLTYYHTNGQRVTAYISTVDELADWCYKNGYGQAGKQQMNIELDTLKDHLKYKQQKIDDLIKTYGTGVRPSWVSGDLSILEYEASSLANQIKQMEERLDA